MKEENISLGKGNIIVKDGWEHEEKNGSVKWEVGMRRIRDRG